MLHGAAFRESTDRTLQHLFTEHYVVRARPLDFMSEYELDEMVQAEILQEKYNGGPIKPKDRSVFFEAVLERKKTLRLGMLHL